MQICTISFPFARHRQHSHPQSKILAGPGASRSMRSIVPVSRGWFRVTTAPIERTTWISLRLQIPKPPRGRESVRFLRTAMAPSYVLAIDQAAGGQQHSASFGGGRGFSINPSNLQRALAHTRTWMIPTVMGEGRRPCG